MDSAARPADVLADGPGLAPGIAVVAQALDRVGYRTDAVRGLLGVVGDIATAPADLAIYVRRLEANAGDLADTIALLALGRRRPTDRIAAVFGRPAMDALVSAGALVEQDGLVSSALCLVPHGDLWIAADQPPAPGSVANALRVTGINPPATLLAALTVYPGAGTALDVGTGNGIQSLLLARRCDHVVATDINPRALAFATFNAALNGVDTIEVREGSLLEPVAGERFDVIVSNPPYVISPDHDLVYRDSGQEPGALCAALVGALPEHLADHGFATTLASWPLAAGCRWSDVPRSWLTAGCRAWLLQLGVDDVLVHAQQWNARLALEGDMTGFGAAVDRWMKYAAVRRIEQIGYGAVVLAQRAGECTVVRADEVRAGHGNAGAHIKRVFAAHELLAEVDNDAVLAGLTCQVPAEHRVDRGSHNVGGVWRPGNAIVSLVEGVGIEATLDPLMTEVFLLVTSGATVSAAATQAGQQAGVASDQIHELIAAAVSMVHDLLALGIVVAGPSATDAGAYPGASAASAAQDSD